MGEDLVVNETGDNHSEGSWNSRDNSKIIKTHDTDRWWIFHVLSWARRLASRGPLGRMNCTYAPSLKFCQHLHLPNEHGANLLQHPLVFLQLKVLLPIDIGEAPFLWNNDFLATGELVAGTTEGLLYDVGVGILTTDGQKDLANIDSGSGSVRFSPSTSHTGLQPNRVLSNDTNRYQTRHTYQRQRRTTSYWYEGRGRGGHGPSNGRNLFRRSWWCTYWRRYEPLREPRLRVVRIHQRQGERRKETRRRKHAFGPSQRSWSNWGQSWDGNPNRAGETLESGTPLLYRDFGYGLFLQ